MKQIFTLIILGLSFVSFSQSEMKTPTKIITINNAGNPIKPVQKTNKRELSQEKVFIKKSEFKSYPKKKQKAILREPEKYVIIE